MFKITKKESNDPINSLMGSTSRLMDSRSKTAKGRLFSGQQSPKKLISFGVKNDKKVPPTETFSIAGGSGANQSKQSFSAHKETPLFDLKPYKQPKTLVFPKIFGFLVLLLLIVITVFLYQLYSEGRDRLISGENQSENSGSGTEILLSEISKVIILPEDEAPVIRTVTDAQSLKNQTFFVNAQNGDKVVIYQKAQKAILYRPSTQKLVNVASINLGNENDSEQKDQKSEDADGTGNFESPESDMLQDTGQGLESVFGQLNVRKPSVKIAVYATGMSYDERVAVQNNIKDQLIDYEFEFTELNKLKTNMSSNALIKIKDVDPIVEDSILNITRAKEYSNDAFGLTVEEDLVLILVR